jgi:hypothetical protein
MSNLEIASRYGLDVDAPEQALTRPDVTALTPSVVALIPLLEVAVKLGVEPTTVRRMIWKGQVQAHQFEGSRGYFVNVETLPPKYRAKFAVEIERCTPGGLQAVEGDDVVSRYAVARDTVRERAELRYEAVLSFAKARLNRAAKETLGQAERRWLRNFKRSHPGMKVSIRSVKSWTDMFVKNGATIDALVDGNDGTKQSGSRIPAVARRMFRDEYLRAHRPNLRLIYENVLSVGAVKGWGPIPSYYAFRRYAKKLPQLVKRLLRDSADTPRAVLPHVRRDPTTLAAYHTIQADHREIDVPVRCDAGCETCTGKKPKGHFPIWTAFIDIRSRRILGTDIAIDAPNSDRILSVFRRICEENGLPRRVYLDNGADFRKAFGKRLRKQGKAAWDGPNEEQLQARFAPLGIEVIYAIPYNAQAKAIERMFRTFRHRFDEDFEAYRGTLGQKSELARELFYRPSELPTISELAFLLQLAISQYNGTAHTGRGMDGLTPDAVFYDASIRMPRREPDHSFAFLFFDLIKGGRIVGPNGVLHDGHVYRLESLQRHLEYFGERVDVRINPDDVRDAMIFDRRTGAYVCAARLDDEATYDTRDAITRQLIERVFSDGKALLKMARAHVEGAKERLAEYRVAKLEYLKRRVAEIEAARREAEAALTGTDVVSVISRFSAIEREPASSSAIDLTASRIAEVLDADAAAAAPLCVVSPPKRERKARATGRSRSDALTWQDIADLLGISKKSLERYRLGILPWPAGMQERFEALEQARNAPSGDVALPDAPTQPRRTRVDGELSWANIARDLDMHPKMLRLCRQGKRPWPTGAQERFEQKERQRSAANCQGYA